MILDFYKIMFVLNEPVSISEINSALQIRERFVVTKALDIFFATD
jgi:hypothetical protein